LILTLKKQLTADKGGCTPINQKFGSTHGLT